jgi:membrane protein
VKALSGVWELLKDTVVSFIDDDALSRGAAISFYTVTSIAPLLLIVIAIAGLAFGREAAQNAIIGQLSGLMGDQRRRYCKPRWQAPRESRRESWRRLSAFSLLWQRRPACLEKCNLR